MHSRSLVGIYYTPGRRETLRNPSVVSMLKFGAVDQMVSFHCVFSMHQTLNTLAFFSGDGLQKKMG